VLDERTVQTAPAPERPSRSSDPASSRSPALALLWRVRWVLAVGVLLLAGLLVVLWANTRPGYDPYGWLVWGHLTIHGKLDTNGAPSWKPLPFLFTVPFAFFGLKAMWLWMLTAITISLSGLVFAARIAFKLSSPDGERRYAGCIAAVFAAGFLFMIRDYTHYMLSAQSDTMIVSLCLGAIDCHLYGRRKWAFAFAVLAGLGRPEAWPMLGLYGIWLWRSVPGMRAVVVFGLALIPLMWFGIPALTSKSWFTAGNIALKSPRALHENKLTGEIDRFLDLHETIVYVLALAMVGIAALRRDRRPIIIAGVAIMWVIVEVAFVLHGWPGVPRYLFESGGMTAVLAGTAIGAIAVELPSLLRRLVPRVSPLVGTAAALLIAVVVAGSLVPAAHSRITAERADLKHERDRTKIINHLQGLIARLGGPKKLFYCGQPTTGIGLQSVLAWEMGVNTGVLFWTPHLGTVDPRPVVLFRVTPHAWKVTTIDTAPAKKAACQKLNVVSLLSRTA
jgi:hypothetical protein